MRCWKGWVQSVTDAPIEEVLELVQRCDVIMEVGGWLKHPVDVSLPWTPQLGPICPEVKGPLMEEDCVKVSHWPQHIPVLSQKASGLRTPSLEELFWPKLPKVLLTPVRLAPGQNVLGVHFIVQSGGCQNFPVKFQKIKKKILINIFIVTSDNLSLEFGKNVVEWDGSAMTSCCRKNNRNLQWHFQSRGRWSHWSCEDEFRSQKEKRTFWYGYWPFPIHSSALSR